MTVTALHPERNKAAARGDLTQRLVDVAGDLAILVRDEGADKIARFLAGYTLAEKDALLIVLAAMVPIDDATTGDLLAWVTWDEHGQPLDGAAPAVARHRPEPESEPRMPAREQNLATFAELVAQGLGAEEAAVRMGKSRRTGSRYARTLREREAEKHRADLERELRERAEERRHAA